MIRWLWDPESANPYQVIRGLRVGVVVVGVVLFWGGGCGCDLGEKGRGDAG